MVSAEGRRPRPLGAERASAAWWAAEDQKWEPHQEKEGIGALGGGQGGGMISMKHSAITLKRPGAVHIYLPKC
jgi:hypothetical protein